jgi:hypothetical protein
MHLLRRMQEKLLDLARWSKQVFRAAGAMHAPTEHAARRGRFPRPPKGFPLEKSPGRGLNPRPGDSYFLMTLKLRPTGLVLVPAKMIPDVVVYSGECRSAATTSVGLGTMKPIMVRNLRFP